MRTYNPCLKNMVENTRDSLDNLGVSSMDYTDEELFRLIEFWSGMSTYEESFEAVLDDVKAGTKR